MAADGGGDTDRVQLGTWPSDHALTVIQALQASGIQVRAARAASGSVRVEVDAAERGRAQAVVARVTDAVSGTSPTVQPAATAPAAAVPPEEPSAARPASAALPGPGNRPPASPDPPLRPLLFERLRRLARPLALVTAVMVAIVLAYRGPVTGAFAVGAAVVGVAAWLAGRRDDGGHGPGP